jgi:hypothetical protein
MFAVPDNTVAVASATAPRHPVRVALEYAADRDRWRTLLRYDPEERFSALVTADAEQEVWLLGWLPGQYTDLHDHGPATGAFTVVSGRLTETVARRAPRCRARVRAPGPQRGPGSRGEHPRVPLGWAHPAPLPPRSAHRPGAGLTSR